MWFNPGAWLEKLSIAETGARRPRRPALAPLPKPKGWRPPREPRVPDHDPAARKTARSADALAAAAARAARWEALRKRAAARVGRATAQSSARGAAKAAAALGPPPPADFPTGARSGGRRPAAAPGARALAGLAW